MSVARLAYNILDACALTLIWLPRICDAIVMHIPIIRAKNFDNTFQRSTRNEIGIWNASNDSILSE